MRSDAKRERIRSRTSARHEKCQECEQDWNVSKLAKVPWTGYICPRCREKFRRIMKS